MTKETYKELYVRVPVFGDGMIKLYDESKEAYDKFEDEINRLRKIPHLGILHYFSGIPKYSRYDHVMLMLLLIQQISENKSTDIKLKNKLKIGNVEFSSIEEFLKSLSLLYPIGHFQMTFTSEYAFLKFLVRNNKSNDFIEEISNRINVSDDILKNKLIETFRIIIKDGKIFSFSKIVMTLKLMDRIKKGLNKDFEKKLLAIMGVYILRNGYIENVSKSYKQERKLKKTLDYFLTIRDLAFLILDGTISQHVLNLSPYSIINHLDKFVSEEPYRNLLNDLKKFYDDTIYMSEEGQYYHYRVSNKIRRDVFEKKKFLPIQNIVDDIIKNNYDEDIKKVIKEEIEKIDKDKSNGKIEKILKHHIRVMLTRNLKNSIYADNKCFDELEYAYGGISYYVALREYRADIYPRNDDKQTLIEYSNDIWEVADSLYDILKNNSFKLEFKRTSDLLLLHKIEFFKIFNPIAKYLASNYLSVNTEFQSYKIKYREILGIKRYIEIKFPIMFKLEDIEHVIEIMKKCKETLDEEGGDKGEINEINQIIKILEDIKNTKHENQNVFYILSPQVSLIKNDNEKSEIDFLLIEYESNRDIVLLGQLCILNFDLIKYKNKTIKIKIKIGETKTNKKHHKVKQLTDQLCLSFGIDKETAYLLTSSENVNGYTTIKTIKNDGKSRMFMKEIIINKIYK